MISTRGRYLLRILVDLARHGDKNYVPLKDIAERQDISLKYLEQLLPMLKKNAIVSASAGKGGGYKLARDPSECAVKEILDLTERALEPVACMRNLNCPRKDACATLPMWQMYGRLTDAFFKNITIDDLAKGNLENNAAMQALKIIDQK